MNCNTLFNFRVTFDDGQWIVVDATDYEDAQEKAIDEMEFICEGFGSITHIKRMF